MKRKKKWMRMLAATAFAVILALPFSAMADETHVAVDLERRCKLNVEMSKACLDDKDEVKPGFKQLKEMLEEPLGDTPGAITIDLYQIARAVKDGNYDDYKYEAVDKNNNPYAQIIIEANDYLKDETKTSEEWDSLAQSAVKLIKDSQSAGNAAIQPISSSNSGFSFNVSSGLYLVLIRETGLADYFTGSDRNLATRVRTNNYEYTFSPALISLPAHSESNDGGYSWEYGVNMTPKASVSYRYGSLMLAKTLEGYRAGEPATFLFRVQSSYDDGRAGAKFECNELVTLSYDANSPATQVETLDVSFPIGAPVTVTEIYSGSSYSLVAGGVTDEPITVSAPRTTANGILVPADTLLVEFTNVYNRSGNRGGAVENSFENTGAGWTWTQTTADSNGQTTTGPVAQQPVVTPAPSTSPEPGNAGN